MRHAEVTLDDKFLLTEGRVFITAVARPWRALASRRRTAPVETAGRTALHAHRTPLFRFCKDRP
jgi:hypothetical protein